MLSERIHELRLDCGWNQVELAKRLNVAKQTVSNWENDNVLPSIEMLEKIANFFSVSTDYLLGRTERTTLDVSSLTVEQISHISLIIKDFEKLNAK